MNADCQTCRGRSRSLLRHRSGVSVAFFAAAAIIVAAAPSSATTWYVPGDVPTIAGAVVLASAGDEIVVACDTYYEYGIALKSGVALRSATGLPDCVTIDAQGLGRVFYCSGVDNTAVVQGFTVTGGAAGDGGGMYCVNSSPQVLDCVFDDNSATDDGGGLFAGSGSSVTLTDCSFLNGSAGDKGGGIYGEYGGSVGCTRCTFTGNYAGDGGGAVCFWSSGCVGSFDECVVNGNDGFAGGGGIRGIYASVTVSNSEIFDNTGGNWGGGFWFWRSTLTITGCEIYGNSVGEYGGGVDFADMTGFIAGCVLYENSAGIGGGGLSCGEGANAIVEDCTFADNSAPGGACAFMGAACAGTFSNTILAFGVTGDAVGCEPDASATLYCCDVFGNDGGDWIGCITGQGGTNGNISADPLFCRADNPDDPFTLRAGSPCLAVSQPSCGLIGARSQGCGPGGVIVCTPDPKELTATVPTSTVDVDYLGGGGGLVYGYSISFTWDDAIASTAAVQVTEGPLLADLGGTFFFPFDVSGNEILVDCALLGLQPGATGPGTLFTIEFTGLALGTSDIDITVLEVRDRDNVHLTGFPEDDGLLVVDVSPPTVTDVLIWNDTLPHTDDYIKNGDTARVTATVLDDDPSFDITNLSADLVGLGGGATDPPTTYNSLTGAAVWTATITPVTCLPLDGTVTVTVSAADPIGNPATPGSDTIIADNTAPTAVLDFDASPGHEKCDLTWMLGTDLYLDGTVIQRNDNAGEYPTYPLFVGAWPVVDAYYPPDYSSGTNVFTGAGATASDGVIPRNIYYYQAFCYDIVRNYGVAAASARDLATNYWLGDVTASLGFWDGYNGHVNDADIDKLGGTYYVIAPAWPDNQCDVGPTVHPDNSRFGLPLPDAWVEFEDLMIFAMNYGHVSPRVVPFLPEESSKALSLELAELGASGESLIEIALRLEGNASEVKGLSTVLSYDSSELEFVSARLSDDMSSPLAPVFFWHASDGSSVQIDLAVLGTDVTVGGSGEVAIMTYRALSDEYALEFESATVRSGDNEDLVAGFEGIESKPEVPAAFRLVGNLPNPFNPVTKIAYEMPREADVAIRIYDVSGRLVRTLVDQRIEPGRHEAVWNGRNDTGEPVGSGVYFCTMDAEGFHGSHKMTLLK